MTNLIKKFYYEILGVAICALAIFISSDGTMPGEWYKHLSKPSFNPPNYVFAPVWTLLYFMMGIALGRIMRAGNSAIAAVFFVQLFLNIIWSDIFFVYHKIDLALLDIGSLWLSIGFLIYLVRNDKLTALLLTPYFLWVSFAAFLNYNLWVMN